jgi:predicted sulfurtransferase
MRISGILKYVEDVGGAHYTANYFLLDYRTALNPTLETTRTVQCLTRRAVPCPHCIGRSQRAADQTAAGRLTEMCV